MHIYFEKHEPVLHTYVCTCIYHNKSHHYVMPQPMECPGMCSVHVCVLCVRVCVCVRAHHQTMQKHTAT